MDSVISLILDVLLWIPIVTVSAVGALIGLMVSSRGRTAVGLLWLATTLAMGYELWYRGACSQPLTCDVGGVEYWMALLPRYSILWGITCAVAVLVVRWRGHDAGRTSGSRRARSRSALLGGVGAVAGFCLAALLLVAFDRGTCQWRPLRRADGTIGTQCEIR
jgi:hypothetical protein